MARKRCRANDVRKIFQVHNNFSASHTCKCPRKFRGSISDWLPSQAKLTQEEFLFDWASDVCSRAIHNSTDFPVHLYTYIWVFPKIGVPPKHPQMIIFSRKTHGCWVPPFLETSICISLNTPLQQNGKLSKFYTFTLNFKSCIVCAQVSCSHATRWSRPAAKHSACNKRTMIPGEKWS